MNSVKAILNKIVSAILGWFRGPGWGLALFFAAVFIGSIIFLLESESPWKRGLESLEEGKRPSLRHFVVSGLWWGALINTFLAAGALALRKWWGGTVSPSLEAPPAKTNCPASCKLFWPLLLGAVVVCGLMAWPRMSLSLWGDEEHTLRSSVKGEYVRAENGEFVFKEHTWQRNFFNNVNPNNHMLNTLLMRVSIDTWRSLDGGKAPLFFDERAARLPAFIGGLCGIVMLGLLGRALGLPWAGLLAAWLAAFHPWFLRYTSEARGYGLMLCFLPMALLFAVRALRHPSWGNWIGLGLAQFFALYSYPGVLHSVLLLNGGLALALILRNWNSGGAPIVHRLFPVELGRMFAGGLVGAMLLIQLYAPCYPQLVRYIKGDRAQAGAETLGMGWLKDFAAHLAIGTPWGFADPTNTLAVTVEKLSATHSHLPWLIVLLGILAVVGLLRLLLTAGPSGRILAVIFCCAVPMAFVSALITRSYLYFWYLYFGLPYFILCAGCGAATCAGWLGRLRFPRQGVLGPIFAVLLLAWFFHGTAPQRHLMQTHPVEAQRESVLVSRQELGIGAKDRDGVITVQMKRGGGHMMTVPSYDPAAYYVENAEELKSLIAKADAERLPLFVNLAMPDLARDAREYPDVMAILDDAKLFALARQLPGLEPNVTRFVYRYIPGSMQSHD